MGIVDGDEATVLGVVAALGLEVGIEAALVTLRTILHPTRILRVSSQIVCDA